MNQRINNTGQRSIFALFKTTNVQKLFRTTALAVLPAAALLSTAGNANATFIFGFSVDDIPIIGSLIDTPVSKINGIVDAFQNNLPVSKVYFGVGNEYVQLGHKFPSQGILSPDDNGKDFHKLDNTTINTVFGLNGVTIGLLDQSTILRTNAQLNNVEINLYQPFPNGISVWDNSRVDLNNVTINAKAFASEAYGIGTKGLKVYGINEDVSGNHFTTNGVRTGIEVTASNISGHFPLAHAPRVYMQNADIHAFSSGVESNGMELVGNPLNLAPTMQPDITLEHFNINVKGTPLRLNNVKAGAIATWGGTLNLNDGIINMEGNGYSIGCTSLGLRCTTAGVVADGGSIVGSNSKATLNDVEIHSTGNEIGGVYAIGRILGGDPEVDAKNLTVTTDGLRSYGLYADGSNIYLPIVRTGKATINAENIEVRTNGTRAYGVFANNGAIINITNNAKDEAGNPIKGAIGTNGFRAYGVFVSGSGSIANVSDVDIETNGEHAYGLVAKGRNPVENVTDRIKDFANVPIVNNALSFADDLIKKVPIVGNILGGLVDGSANLVANADQYLGAQGATINLTNSTLHAKGDNAYAIYFGPTKFDDEVPLVGGLDLDPFAGGKVNLVNSKVYSDNSYGIFVDDANLGDKGDVTAKDSEIGGRDGLFYVKSNNIGIPVLLERKSQLNLTVDNTKLYGRAITEKTSFDHGILGTLDNLVEKFTGVDFFDVASGVSNVSLSNGSDWTIDGNSNVTNLTLNNSSIHFAKNAFNENNGNGFVNLTIDKNYVGNNGTIVFNTKLGDSNSPTDFLHIVGNASGDTNVAVVNRGGLGALTKGDGIKLIQIDGSENTAKFNFKGDSVYNGQSVVYGGAYAYSLYQNGVTNPTDGNWYLRSVYDPGHKTPDNVVYQAGAATYEVYGEVLKQLNAASTLRQRMGNRVWMGTQNPQPFKKGALSSEEPANVVDGRGFWMRVDGSTSHINPDKSTTGADYGLDMVKAQLGLDFTLAEMDTGTFVGGVFAQYGHGKAEVNSYYGDGKIETDAYGFGGNLTWYGANDIYVDAQAAVNWFDSDLYSKKVGRDLTNGNDGIGYVLSVEGGRKFVLNHEWSVTPQAQLSWNSIDFDDFTDAFDARVKKDDGDSLLGRLGVQFDRETQWQGADGKTERMKTYLAGNLYYEFLDDGTKVDLAGVTLLHRDDQFWGGLGVGTSYNWSDDAYSLYGEVNARSSFNDFGDSYALSGTVGFKAKF